MLILPILLVLWLGLAILRIVLLLRLRGWLLYRLLLLLYRCVMQFGFNRIANEVKDSVYLLLKLLRVEAIGQFHLNLAMVLLGTVLAFRGHFL